MNRFRRVSRFTIQGARVMEYIDTTNGSAVVCSWLGCKRGVYYGQAYTKDLPYLKALADELNLTLEETSRKGWFNTVLRYRKRYGVIVGAVVCLITWTILSNVVVTIEVRGNETLTEEAILSCLESVGLYEGAYIPNVDFKSCEYALRLDLDGVGWASIRHDWGRVVVSIDETTPTPEMLHDNNPCNLVAKVSASVVSVKVLNGQLMTPIGNGVTEGQLLISGIIKDDKENVRYVHAMGEVIGEYTQTITLQQPLTETLTSKSGNAYTYTDLQLFNLEIPLYVGAKHLENSHVTTNTEYFELFGNSVPIGITTTTAESYVTTTQTYTEDQAKEILKARRKTYEENFLKGVEVVNVEEEFSNVDDTVRLSLTYTLQGNICEVKDLYIR